MNLKSRLFGNTGWQHQDASERAQAVAESDDPELRKALPELAQHDEDVIVRLAALQRIDSEPFWLDARLRESDPAIVDSADAFLKRAVMRKADDRLGKERLEWFARIDDAEFVRNAARHAPDRALRAAAQQRINAQGFLGDCFVGESDDALAEALIERIEQESTLERIIGELRKTSKKRERLAARQLARVRAAAGKGDAEAEGAGALVRQIEALSRGEFDGDREARLETLESQWAGLEQPSESLERRFLGAARIVRRSLAIPAQREQPEPATSTEPEQAPNEELAKLGERIEAAASQDQLDDNTAQQLLSDWDRQWNRLDLPSAADQELRDKYLPMVTRLQKVHESATHAQTRKAETPKKDHAARIDSRLEEIGTMLEQGEISTAHQALRKLRAEFDRLPSKQRPRAAGGRLSRHEGRLKEMRNWQHWSNNQVRDELIEQVEQLAGSEQHPDAITTALKQAREEWQRLEKLEVLPGDKRRFAAPPGQWRRFQAACKSAFDQARPFFVKRNQVQEENLETLDAFIARGHEIASQEPADGKELLAFQRKARQAIRRMDDLPPKARGRSAARLRELMDRISACLDGIYEEVEQVKRKLVAEARKLAHESDLRAAIARAKELQAQWQQAGTGRRRIEQKLWKEFRQPIDPLFEQLKGAQQQQRQQNDEAVAELREFCEQAEALAGLPDDDLIEAKGRLKGLSEQWQAQAGRPRNLERRFEQAVIRFDKRVVELRSKQQRAARQQIEKMVHAIQQAWQRRLEGQDIGQAPGDFEPQDSDGELARALHATLEKFNDPETDLSRLETTVEENAEAARQIAIEMEFLAGLESPAEDRSQRMDYQVKRLARRLSERDRQPDLATELEALIERWYRAQPLPIDQHKVLAKRFDKSRKVIESMIA